MHIYVRKDRDTAEFWLYPEVQIAVSKGFAPQVLSRLVAVIEERRTEIESAWNDYFA